MQYFKHMGVMRHDPKIKRLINRYGIEGYGLYNLILETITENLTTEKPIPDIQETYVDLAEFYNGNSAHVEEMVNFMVNQGLLEFDDISHRIICNKIYKFLEQSQTRSPQIRELIKSWKGMSDTVPDIYDRTRTEQEQNKNKNKEKKYPTLEEFKTYVIEKALNLDADKLYEYYSVGNWYDSKGNKVKNWKQKLLALNNYSKDNKNVKKDSWDDPKYY